MPEWMDKCVARYKEEHPDSDDDSAWAICTEVYKKKFGHPPSREDVIRPHLTMLQELVGTETVKLTFSDDERRQLIQKAVDDLYAEPDNDGYTPWGSTWYITAVYETHVVIMHNDRLFAIPYEIADQHTVELGEPEEVVAAYITTEAETLDLLMHEGWLPKGITQTDLADGDFAWLSFEYQQASSSEKGKMNKRAHRKLPYKIRGKVSVEGWLAAWKAIRWTTYLRPSLRGGPSRDAVMERLKNSKPSKIKLDKEGHVSVKEDVSEDARSTVLYEGELSHFMVEEATADEKSKFALVFSGNVIPQPNTEHGVLSANNRLYRPAAVEETYRRSLGYLNEGGVATVFTSHAAASQGSDRLPVGKVLSYAYQDTALKFRGGIVDTTEGSDAIKLLEAGVLGTVSLRSYDWSSHNEEVDGLGDLEVVDWCVIKGIDFATSPGLPGTQITQEDVTMKDWKDVTLEELRTERPDLVAELVAGVQPEEQPPESDAPSVNEEQEYEMAVLRAANTGLSSVVAARLRVLAETVEQIPGVLEQARKEAVNEVYQLGRPAASTNLRGEAEPAPTPAPAVADSGLSDLQRAIIESAGGEYHA